MNARRNNCARTAARLIFIGVTAAFMFATTAPRCESSSTLFGMHSGATRKYLKAGETPNLGSGPVDFSDALNIGIRWERPGPGINFPLNADFADWIYTNIP